jgi:hypothetical protein
VMETSQPASQAIGPDCAPRGSTVSCVVRTSLMWVLALAFSRVAEALDSDLR